MNGSKFTSTLTLRQYYLKTKLIYAKYIFDIQNLHSCIGTTYSFMVCMKLLMKDKSTTSVVEEVLSEGGGGLTGSIESQVAGGLCSPDAEAISDFMWLKVHQNQHLGVT